MIKRFFALLTVLTLLVSGFSIMTSFASEEKYAGEIDFVTTLGFMSMNEGGDFGYGESVTRAALASILYKMEIASSENSSDSDFSEGDYTGFGKDDWKNMDDESEERPQPQILYSDVPEGFWAFEAIKHSVNAGYLSLYSDGTFKPDEYVTNLQAIKAFVRLLGYDVKVQTGGGELNAYLLVANEIRLLGGVSIANYNESIKKEVLAKLVNSALSIDLFVINSVGDNFTYTKAQGKTLLTERHEIFKINGRVTANEVTSIKGGDLPIKKYVLIDDVNYSVGTTNASDLLGYYVTVYYRQQENDSKKTIMHIAKRETTEVLKVDAKDISGFSNRSFSYYENDKIRTISVSNSVSIIYNGKLRTTALADSEFVPMNGSVTFMGEAGKYDLVIINSYRTMVVGYVDAVNYTVYDKLNPGNKLVVDEETLIYRDGKASSINEIREYTILSYSDADPQNHFYTLYASSKSVTGKLSSLTLSASSNEETQFGIDEKEYYVSREAKYKQPGAVFDTAMGDVAKFYFDYFGKIYYASKEAAAFEKYAYLINVDKKKTDLDAEMKFQIFTVNGEMKIIEGARTMTLNDTNGMKTDNVAKALAVRDTTLYAADIVSPVKAGGAIPQLIQYELNGEGKISNIQTAAAKDGTRLSFNSDGSVKSGRVTADGFQLIYMLNGIANEATAKLKTKATQGTMSTTGSGHVYAEGTVVAFYDRVKTKEIYVPQNDKSSTDVYMARNVDYSNDGNYSIQQVFTAKVNGMIADIVIRTVNDSAQPVVERDNTIMLASKVSKTVLKDGTDACTLYGLYNGSQVAYICKDTRAMQQILSINPGDTIRIQLDINNNITASDIIYDLTNDIFHDREGSFTSSPFNVISYIIPAYAYSRAYESNIVRFYAKKSTDPLSLFAEPNYNMVVPDLVANTALFRIYLFDRATKKASLTTYNEIKDFKGVGEASKTIIYERYGDSGVIVIYK